MVLSSPPPPPTLQKPLRSLGLSFLSCKIRDLDYLPPKVLPALSDILKLEPRMTRLGSPREWGPVSGLRQPGTEPPANTWPRSHLLSHPSSCCESREAETEALTAGRLWISLRSISGSLALC